MARDPKAPASTTANKSPANLPRRFYKTASVGVGGPPYAIHLDGKPVRTPQKSLLAVPTRALAEAVAAEWEAQGPAIDTRTMPLTKLANSAIDRIRLHRRRAIDEIMKYAGSDLVCYRATEPGELVRRQADVWDAIVAWAGEHLAAEFRVVGGIVFADQPPETMAAVQTYLGGRRGKLTARERIELLLDKGSFEEFDMFVEHRSTDFGMEKQRSRATASSPAGAPSTAAGLRLRQGFHRVRRLAVETHAQKICKVQDMAMKAARRSSASTTPAARASRKASRRSAAMPRCSSATCSPRA
jgi:hypothetical protein